MNFNCTIQELKLPCITYQILRREHFNCTIQELKRQKPVELYTWLLNFNCTIQELKRIKLFGAAITFRFQLHHTGIKTWNTGVGGGYDEYFNCTIQELKRFYEHFIIPPFFISIAPYRN